MTGLPRSDALVLFGATGDLARKKLFPSLYALARAGRLTVPVIGVALSDLDDEGFRLHVARAVEASADDVEEDVLARLVRSVSLVS
ncbi:MAG: glucose-6-phosphate dehydrogenase, partial [Actinobacteria bacterium]|nr:glucose-6-phosphate dehydrogenase [Actinomycetota bacterium]